MNKKVSNIQMGMLLSLIMCGFFLGMSDIMIIRKSSSEILFSMILGSIIGIIPILMYLKINDTYPNLNIFEKCIKLFGKKIGLIINILILISYILIFSIATRTIIIFATSKYLENTPYLLVGLFVIICCFIASFNGIETLLRLAQVSFIITVITSIFIETTILGYIDINNIMPFLSSQNPIYNIISGALYFALTSSVLCFLLLSINKNKVKNNKNFNKTIIIFYMYSTLSLTIVMFFIISCFGRNLSSLFRYPEYMILKKIGFSSSELHLENFLAFRWTFYSLALSCTSLYGIFFGINNYFKRKKINKIIVIIIAFISIILGKTLLNSTTNTLSIMKNYYIPFLAIPIFLLLTIIFIKCIKKEHHK